MSQIAHIGESISSSSSVSGLVDGSMMKIMGSNSNMMGFGNTMMGGYSLWANLTWLLLIAFLISGIYFFIKQANKK